MTTDHSPPSRPKKPKKPPRGTEAGPPTQMILGGFDNPQYVTIGNRFVLSLASLLLDKDGQTVTGETSKWDITQNVPTSPGITIVRATGLMNGTLTIPAFEAGTIIEFKASTERYPLISVTGGISLRALNPTEDLK